MTTVTVITNDYECDRRSVTILENGDFERVVTNWQNEDRILIEMQDHPYFEGRRRWCDLTPTHWRLMIATAFGKVAALNDEQRGDPQHPVMLSLHFLIGGLIYCLQQRTESQIELMRICRISDTEVVYDYHACLNMAIDLPKPRAGLRVVIDNG